LSWTASVAGSSMTWSARVVDTTRRNPVQGRPGNRRVRRGWQWRTPITCPAGRGRVQGLARGVGRHFGGWVRDPDHRRMESKFMVVSAAGEGSAWAVWPPRRPGRGTGSPTRWRPGHPVGAHLSVQSGRPVGAQKRSEGVAPAPRWLDQDAGQMYAHTPCGGRTRHTARPLNLVSMVTGRRGSPAELNESRARAPDARRLCRLRPRSLTWRRHGYFRSAWSGYVSPTCGRGAPHGYPCRPGCLNAAPAGGGRWPKRLLPDGVTAARPRSRSRS